MKAHDIYAYRNTEQAKKAFQNACERYAISKENKELITQHIEDHILDKSLKEETRRKYLYDWAVILQWLPKSLANITEQEIKTVLKQIKACEYSERSKETYFTKFKLFYKWYKRTLRRRDEMPSKDLNNALTYLLEEYTFRMDKDKEAPVSFIAEDEVIRLIEATEAMEHKALFSLLWHTGCRIGEILTLRLSDVKSIMVGGHQGFHVMLRKSKTTLRTIPVLEDNRVNAVRYLRMQIQMRERQGASQSDVLFVNMHDEPLEYRASKKWLDKASQRAGLGKRVHFHGIRKGRATHLAERGYSESEMNQLMGWRHGSKMPAVYIQRSGMDITRKMAEDLGLETPESVKEQYAVCGGCGNKNDPERDYCSLCGRPVNVEVALAQAEQEKQSQRELLKAYAREMRADILAEIKAELQS